MRIKEASLLAGWSICSHREMSDYLTGKINSERADNGAASPETPAAGEIYSNCKAERRLMLSGFIQNSMGVCPFNWPLSQKSKSRFSLAIDTLKNSIGGTIQWANILLEPLHAKI
jgi:hypothetical protein